MASDIPAGWYPDIHGTIRWWDGARWTEHVREMDGSADAPAPDAAEDAVLDDTVSGTAEETAAALGQSVSATNSALHRARTTIETRVARRDPASFEPDEADAPVLEAYVRAIASCDVEAMISLLHDDIHTTMPPSPTWIAGRAANEVFYRKMFARWHAGQVAVTPLRANGQPGFAFHRDGAVRAIEVVEVRDGAILRMHHFMQPALVRLFAG